MSCYFPWETGPCMSLGRERSSYHWQSHPTHFRPQISGFLGCIPHYPWHPPSWKQSPGLFSMQLPHHLVLQVFYCLLNPVLWMGHVYPFSNSRGNRTNTAFLLLLGEGVNFTKWFGEDRLLVKHIFQTKRKNRCESFKISKKFYACGRLICPIYPQFSDDIHLENNFSHFKENPPLTPCSPPPMAPLITFLYSKTHSKSCV